MVALRESTYNIDSHSFATKFQNINVLVGGKADIEAIKPEIEKLVSGYSFETVWRTKAIDEEE